MEAFQQPEIRRLPAHLIQFGKRFELTFHELDVAQEHFANCGLVSDGHTWERAIIDYCEENNFDVSELDFDSESDLLSVYSESRASLEKITAIIVEFATDREALQKVLCSLSVEEDSPEELLQLMKEEGVDLSMPVEFEFIIQFDDESNVKSACQKLTEHGYACFYSDALQVATSHETYPNLEKLEELHRAISDVAHEFGGNIEVFSDSDESDEPLEELEDWVRYREVPQTR